MYVNIKKIREISKDVQYPDIVVFNASCDFKVSLSFWQCDTLYSKLSESQRRIERLESELSHYRQAHAREREAREKLEEEREQMKSVLEHMGEGLRSLAVRMPSCDVSSKSSKDEAFENDLEQSHTRHQVLVQAYSIQAFRQCCGAEPT